MKQASAFLLVLLIFGWAVWMSAHAPLSASPSPGGGENYANAGDASLPQPPPAGAGPAAFQEYANALQTATARPMIEATQQAHMTAQSMEQRIFTDGLTATAASALTQQSVDLTATSVAQTATLQALQTQVAYENAQATQTQTAVMAATSVAQTQIAPLIQAQAEAAKKEAKTRENMLYLFVVVAALGFLFVVAQYKQYLEDRERQRADESARKRVVPREGASPLFITQDERIIDPDKAFFPDATQPAPSIDHQERVTQRAQAIQMADRVAKGLAAAPGTHMQNYLANLATQLNGGGAGNAPLQLPPQINYLPAPPPYAEAVENTLLLEGEGRPA